MLVASTHIFSEWFALVAFGFEICIASGGLVGDLGSLAPLIVVSWGVNPLGSKSIGFKNARPLFLRIYMS